MKRNLVTRVDRLEGQDEQRRLTARVIHLGLNGLPEDPTDLDYGGYAIYLPRKAASAEEWVEKVARRFQARFSDGGDINEPPIDETAGSPGSAYGPGAAVPPGGSALLR